MKKCKFQKNKQTQKEGKEENISDKRKKYKNKKRRNLIKKE